MIDGATRFGAFCRVVLPLSAPGVLAAGLYAFTQAWNEFLYALVFITDARQRTLPVGLASFITGDVYGWGYLMAGAVLTTRRGLDASRAAATMSVARSGAVTTAACVICGAR